MNIGVFQKKAIYSHVLAATLDGRTETIAKWLIANGFQAIWPKVADGIYPYKWRPPFTKIPYAENLTAGMVEIFHSYGLTVIGWGFLYGGDPAGEASIAIQQVRDLKLDGYIFDVESQFDNRPTAEVEAYAIVRAVRNALPDTPLAYCGFPRLWNPKTGGGWHPVNVATAFMSVCDVASPMVYQDGDDPAWAVEFLQQSYDQYRRFTDKPYIPAGRAYMGDAGKATKENILAFGAKADTLGLSGLSWWFLDHAVKYPVIQQALALTHQYSAQPSPAPAPVPVPVPVPPVGDDMTIPFVSQVGPGADLFRNDCGIGASAMGIRAFDVGLTDSVDKMTTMVVPAAEAGKRGVYVWELQALFSLYGIPTEILRNQSTASLFALLTANKIVIPLIHYQPLVDAGLTEFKNFGAAHFVVAVGIKVEAGGQKFVVIHDPYATSMATGAFKEIPFAVWDAAWSQCPLDEGNSPYICIATTIPIQDLSKPVVPETGVKYGMLASVGYGINVSKGAGPTSEFGRVKILVKAETPVVYIKQISGAWGLLADGSGWVYLPYLKAI